jgi:hypothetical protein
LNSLLIYIRERAKQESETQEQKNYGLLHCGFLVVSCILLSFCLQQCIWYSTRLGLRIKGAVTTAIFRKALHRADTVGAKADCVSMVSWRATGYALRHSRCICSIFRQSGLKRVPI